MKSEAKERSILSERNLTPANVVKELDRYVIAQDEAKKSVAVALRNRWRRLRVPEELQEDITPKNILMMGPTGVGKTEIARRLAKLAKAPFLKIEATKFTEVGYVGRDVESIIRDLVEISHHIVAEEEREKVVEQAQIVAEEEILDLLLPGSKNIDQTSFQFGSEENNSGEQLEQKLSNTREKFKEKLKSGELEERIIEIEIEKPVHTQMQILGPQGFGEIEGQIKDIFSNLAPKQKEVKNVPVKEARKILIRIHQEKLINLEKVGRTAVERAEQTGIVFIDEIDKICGAQSGGRGPDVSREGVQRDLLPLVEGCTVSTKYGPVKTDHILFIASGAFHISKPSDLMPEFQGRFPIRVNLRSLTPADFVRILKEPENALLKQYAALLKTEDVTVEFKDDAISEIANLTAQVNSKTENIGARRLYTLMEKLLEDLSFNADQRAGATVIVDKEYVRQKLSSIVEDTDLSRFIL